MTPARRYRLGREARRDLEEIWRFSIAAWAEPQAAAYYRSLIGAFDRLAQFPDLARERAELNPPGRIHRHRAHMILYRVEDDIVIIVRILHVRQNWRAILEMDS